MSLGGAGISCYAVLAFLSVLCTGQVNNQNLVYTRANEANVKDSKTQRLQCFDCNSAYDPRCADPFDSYTIGMINCSDRHTPEHLLDHLHYDRQVEPVVCRKIIQKVEGEVRVIRGCGYVRDDHDDKKCFRRIGTAAVEVIYCSCTTSLCNTSHPTQRPYFSLIAITVAITSAITTLLGLQTP